jgi:hypothetical protein
VGDFGPPKGTCFDPGWSLLIRPVTASEAVERRIQQLDNMAKTQEGNDALVARATSEYLKRIRSAGDDFVEKAKLVSSTLNFDALRTREALQRSKEVARQYMEANDSLEKVALDPTQTYREELLKAGMGSPAIEQAVREFKEKPVPQQYWDANRRYAQAQLQVMEFLDTSWGAWSVQPSPTSATGEGV